MGRLLLALVNNDVILRSKVKDQGHWKRKYKIVLAHIFVKKWANLHHSNTKMITGPFYTYRAIHFSSGNA